jgi:hypothetical protein
MKDIYVLAADADMEAVFRAILARPESPGIRPRPRDFERIALRADLQAWISSPSFRILKETLQNWFPRT